MSSFYKLLRIVPDTWSPLLLSLELLFKVTRGFLVLSLTGCSEPRCFNGGVCRQALYFSDFVCQCPEGFMGKRCEIGEW